MHRNSWCATHAIDFRCPASCWMRVICMQQCSERSREPFALRIDMIVTGNRPSMKLLANTPILRY